MQRFTRTAALPLLALIVLALIVGPRVATTQATTDAGQAASKMIGYFAAWDAYDLPAGRNYRIKDMHTSGTADVLTHLNYAFSDVRPDAAAANQVKCQLYDKNADYEMTWTADKSVDGVAVPWGGALRGNFQQLRQLKTIYPNLKVLISLGGWTLSNYLPIVLDRFG